MKVIVIYNQYNYPEREVLGRLVTELGSYARPVQVMTLEEARALYPVYATPAVIFIRADQCGQEMIEPTVDLARLRATALALKYFDEENENIHGMTSYRLETKILSDLAYIGRELVRQRLEHQSPLPEGGPWESEYAFWNDMWNKLIITTPEEMRLAVDAGFITEEECYQIMESLDMEKFDV